MLTHHKVFLPVTGELRCVWQQLFDVSCVIDSGDKQLGHLAAQHQTHVLIVIYILEFITNNMNNAACHIHDTCNELTNKLFLF